MYDKETKLLYEFGPFRLDPAERLLLRHGEKVPLTPKVFDTLLMLVENSGRLLEKDDLLKRVWPESFVEEGNLARNISTLRKVLGENGDDRPYIETIPTRGYRFVGRVAKVAGVPTEWVVEERSRARITVQEEVEAEDAPIPAVNRFAYPEVESSALSKVAARGRWSKSQVAAMVVFGLALLGYTILERSESDRQPEIKSLAVLPLKALDREADGYLELGIADTIINKVSQIEGLTVRATSAVRKYVGHDTEALSVGRQLRVDAVLDGTMQRSGDQLRASFNLLRVRDGKSLWTENFDFPFTELFAIQDQVSRQVASRLRLRLTAAEQARLNKPATSNPQAYQYYLKGIYSAERWSGVSARADAESAIAMFKTATEIDPHYAQAHGQLAFGYAWMALFGEPDNPLWLDLTRQTLAKAESMDPLLPVARIVRAEILFSIHEGYQPEAAIRELLIAQQLDPSIAHEFLGSIYSHMGLAELGERELRRALEIDPTSIRNQHLLGEVHIWSGKYQEAIAIYDRLNAIDPNNPGPYAFGALACLYGDDLSKAEEKVKKALELKPEDPIGLSIRAVLQARKGRFDQAEAIIAEVGRKGRLFRSYHHGTYNIALVFGVQGKASQAVEWLKETIKYGMPNYPMFARDPFLEPIRKHPAYLRFMAELQTRWNRYQQEFQ